SSFKGKVVLIDFWASWCGPCRREMPNVVKAYSKYKDKGFEIYGVSLDQDKDRWIEAIKKDGITWPQVSDLKYWECEAAKIYGVQGIPFTVLLDKEGKIIAKGLRGAELETAIENALAGKSVKAGAGSSSEAK
ncbi:MAG: TlpA family protein disulfide reductase, partial [Bacteroidia bacterium]